ncbi:MAG: hypothetical protein K6A43_00120 [Treponema sp.]|nr:hypothetical protein [Treponema sp.]
MKNISKKIFVVFTLMAFAAVLFAGDYDSVPKKYQPAKFTKAVEKKLGHKCEDYEKSIVDSSYAYYFEETDEKWTKESWESAIAKAAELCSNKAAIAAAKAGKFGEKFLKAFTVSAEDAVNSFTKWLDEKSDEYDNRKK